MKVFISAGEKSGDIILGGVLSELKKKCKIEAFGVGGEACLREGVLLIESENSLRGFGFCEVIPKLYRHITFFRSVVKQLLEFGPDLVLLCDYAEFNYNLAKVCKDAKLKCYYVSPPQVWAWRSYRKEVLKNCLIGGALVLPFETEIWGDEKRFRFFGNPLAYLASFKRWNPIKNQIAIFPGSRPSELKALGKVLADACLELKKWDSSLKFVVALAVEERLAREFFRDEIFSFSSDSLEVLSSSRVAVVKSGSSTVEACVIGVPCCVVYRVNILTEILARFLLKVNAVAIPNLLVPGAVPEFVTAFSCKADKIANFVVETLSNEANEESQLTKLAQVKQKLLPQGQNPFASIADHILSLAR